ncbi:MAG: hypothetical protein H8E66_08810 [Planctomycetes bacterium]|nr:hypothetical protein [Planctomycetota bacterium]
MTITRRELLKGIGSLGLVARVSPLVANDAPVLVDTPRLIGSSKVMLVDHEFIAKSGGVRLKLHPPRKTGERLIESQHTWESATLNWFSVLRDGDRYRMWYECYDVEGWPTADDTSFCYAESTDGIRWTKPQLGLVSYRGNKDNNILFRQVGEGKHRSRVHGSGVFIDPSVPPEARYKCVSQGLFQGIGDRPHYVAGMTSRDGLRWTRTPQPICPVFVDSQYSGFWDLQQQRYVIVGRVSGRGGRAIGRSTSVHFDRFAPFTRVLETDEHDPPESDLYNPACQQYPGSPGLYLMFPSLFRHREDSLDIRLAVSRDGVKWTRPDRETSFIPLGQPLDFDGGSLYMGNGGCLRTGNELSFYFSGSTLKHGEVGLENLTDPKKRRVISRAVARPDRLVSVTAGKTGGRFETPLIRFAGDRLVVNASARPGGDVRVGLLDAEGRPIPGRGVTECAVRSDDKESWTVSWADGPGVARLSEQSIRLRIELRDADVFGFQFEG